MTVTTPPTPEIYFVYTTWPDAAGAQAMADIVVQAGLAACVLVQPLAQATYIWQGQLTHGAEVPVFLKTTAAQYPALQARLKALHPYELPCIVALPLAAGLPDYLGWVAASMR